LAVPVAWGLLAWRSGGVGAGTVLPALLLYAFVGVALFFIDADVHRLPEGLTFPLGISIAALLLVAAAVTQQWGSLGRAAICGVLSFVVYLVLLLASRGQFGFGDVVVGSITGLLLGYLGWPEPYWAAALGFVLGAVVSLARLARRRIGLKTEIAFGPYIVLGALVTVIALR
ncbi:MAG TPA: A24 family peptidase, partial [Dermatophilaceae bacterium]|nr:A24 family peptidase [Dermatophilaceae bacterium]